MSLASRVTALAERVGQEFADGLHTYKFMANVSPTANWKTVTFTLPVPLDTDRGLQGSILADGASSTNAMVVGTLHRHTDVITEVSFRYASIPRDLGASTSIVFVVSGYPA